MKKRLLITLGCSFTEGSGCYDPKTLEEFSGRDLTKLKLKEIGYLQGKNREWAHHHGWPAQLQKLLKYDKLINLAYGGSSNSHAVKAWFEKLSEEDFKNYEVLVVWMMTFSARISFYRDGCIKSMMASLVGGNPENNVTVDSEARTLYDSYANFLGDYHNVDTNLEATFYLKIIQKICELSGYNFFYINVDKTDGIYVDKFMKHKNINSLNPYLTKLYPDVPCIIGDRELKQYVSPICGHPNEEGYALMADRIFNMIRDKQPDLLSTTDVEKYEIEYLGEPSIEYLNPSYQ